MGLGLEAGMIYETTNRRNDEYRKHIRTEQTKDTLRFEGINVQNKPKKLKKQSVQYLGYLTGRPVFPSRGMRNFLFLFTSFYRTISPLQSLSASYYCFPT
jgi:hypothetical protein